MGFVFSGMTGGMLVSLFLAGVVYAKAGYFRAFILVFAALAFDLFLRTIIIEQKTVARYISHGGQRGRCKARPNKSSPRLRNSSLTRNDHYESSFIRVGRKRESVLGSMNMYEPRWLCRGNMNVVGRGMYGISHGVLNGMLLPV